MISYEDALKKAQEVKSNIDKCIEYEKGYYFSSSEDEGYVGGAGHSPVVVQKTDGKLIPMPQFVMNGTGEELREFKTE